MPGIMGICRPVNAGQENMATPSTSQTAALSSLFLALLAIFSGSPLARTSMSLAAPGELYLMKSKIRYEID